MLIRDIGRFEAHFSGVLFGLSKKIRYSCTMDCGNLPPARIRLNRTVIGPINAGRCRKSSATSPSGPGAFLVARDDNAFAISAPVNAVKGLVFGLS